MARKVIRIFSSPYNSKLGISHFVNSWVLNIISFTATKRVCPVADPFFSEFNSKMKLGDQVINFRTLLKIEGFIVE